MENGVSRGFLESKVDWLETELTRLNELLVAVGFEGGIASLKSAAAELLRQGLEIL
jgi:hypothetical protein